MLSIYFMLTLIMGVGAIWQGAVYPGIAGILGPTLCWWASAGLKGSLLIDSSPQKLFGIVAAIAFVAVGLGIVAHSGYWLQIFSYEITGVTWRLIGLALGWVLTNETHTVGVSQEPA